VYVYLLLTVTLISCSACSSQQAAPTIASIPVVWQNNIPVAVPTPEPGPPRIAESFSDSSRIGRSHKNKIQIDIQVLGDITYKARNLAVVKFYSRSNLNGWILRQTLEIEDQAIDPLTPKIDDFNNDGLNDITFISSVAARGANEIRTLLIYDKDRDRLVHIKNSEEYPNIRYNRTLHCIDAFRVYGGTSTDFLRLDGDQLIEFASVENFDGRRTVKVIDKYGKERIILEQPIRDDEVFDRFENYSPLVLSRDD